MDLKNYMNYPIKKALDILLQNPESIIDLFKFNFNAFYYFSHKQNLKNAEILFQNCSKKFEKNLDNIKWIQKSYDYILNHTEITDIYHIILYFLVRLVKPKILIETGVSHGVSSLYILQGIEKNQCGKLFSIDFQINYISSDNRLVKGELPTTSVGICVPSHLRKNWTLILGDSKKELPKLLSKIDSFDFFLHDSDHTEKHMIWEFQEIWFKLRKSGILASDDTFLNNAFSLFSHQQNCNSVEFQRSKSKPKEKFGFLIK